MSAIVPIHNVAWVRPPRQVRSQETLDRILDSAEQLVGAKGFDSVSVAEIVRDAQSSVGAFYARFHDKDALLNCLHERFCEEAKATTDLVLEPEQWKESSIREILSETIPFLVRIYRERRGLIRAFILRGANDKAFACSAVEVGTYVTRKLVSLLSTREDEIRHPQPALALEFGFSLVLAMLDQSVLLDAVERAGLPLDSPLLPQELLQLFLSYLGIDPEH